MPESDGNSPITHYLVEKADTTQRNFLLVGQTDSSPFRFKIRNFDKDKQYMVRVFAVNVVGKSEPAEQVLGEYIFLLRCLLVLTN